jgi:hypothetical protein
LPRSHAPLQSYLTISEIRGRSLKPRKDLKAGEASLVNTGLHFGLVVLFPHRLHYWRLVIVVMLKFANQASVSVGMLGMDLRNNLSGLEG